MSVPFFFFFFARMNGANLRSAKGTRRTLFTCRPNYGAFVRPEKVKVGDYPVEELDLDDEEI